ncbi:MAG: peptide chain release factor N(5)-glutamine methyltransferase [Desulfarculaceae bacterium]|nr:peptide chain release factor N(5)-glutamine methyltransferase [Desulfarculaceae bacterium]MCF8070831.1 peptide chain release factor N(5)-glutamine methyltransferase [Desulfarculaceae bacterium]MCF8102268.1 peptide chain release factor N(5)-glutamine methyltransferase [Desulfarculaceae bacterium]MCF8118037.1 peptide chain release factor N(5)-glutamine methyltransferase [Desulfarculaceae bacterium]
MAETWTVGRLIPWAADYLKKYSVDAARLSGELLLAQVLGCTRLELYLRFDQPLAPEELAAFKALILRRREHEPVAYILGNREFWGLELACGPGALVPRPESEHLVEEGLARLEGLEAPRVLDLCTGTGAVALALASERPDAEVIASDISDQALTWARNNAENLGLAERVSFKQGDLWEAVAASSGFFDLITANPPYVAEDEWEGLPREVKDFEPRLALHGGERGLEATRAIIAGAGAHLRPLGWLLLELGAGQAGAAAELAQASGAFDAISTVPDLGGIERVLICQRKDYG